MDEDITRIKIIAKKRIDPSIIKSIWNQLASELLPQYPAIKNLTMPSVRCSILEPKRYERLESKIQKGNFIDLRPLEYRLAILDPKDSCAFLNHVKGGYLIVKCEGRGSLEGNLRHELLHIFEELLKLPVGTLTVIENKKQGRLIKRVYEDIKGVI